MDLVVRLVLFVFMSSEVFASPLCFRSTGKCSNIENVSVVKTLKRLLRA